MFPFALNLEWQLTMVVRPYWLLLSPHRLGHIVSESGEVWGDRLSSLDV